MLLLRIGRLRTLGQSVSIICVFIAAIVLSVVSLGSTFRQTLAAVVAESDSYIVASVGELASVPSEEGADELLLTCFIDIVDHASGAGAGAARDLRVVVVASSAATETASALDAIFASWRSANYDVIVVDDGGLPGGTLHAAAAGRAVLRVVHASEVACLGLQDSGTSAGILWAIAVGASSVVDLAHPLPLVSAALTLPPNDVTLLPGPADGATARVREHFTSALIVEARRPSRVGHGSSNDAGRRRGEELCVDPVVPDLQLGLCHDRTAWRYGRHSTAAANEPPESGDDSPVRLLEDVAPLVLPPGGVLEWSSHSDGDVAPRTAYSYNRLAGRKAVWLLMGSARSGSRAAVALQLAAAAAGLRIAMLPPGRLCNLSSASAAGVDGVSAAPAVGAAATVAAIAAPDGIAATSAAKAALSGVRDAVQLTMSEVLQMQRWLTLAHSAYKLAANATPSGVQQEQPKARDVTSLPHAHHCYRDHPNVRDTVLVLNFNNFPRNGGNASLPNWGPEQLARLRTLYAPYFPLIIATADVSAVGEAGIPDSNVVPCWGDFERRFGWPGGIVGEDCAARAIAAYPGHLGYAFVQVGAAVDGGVARHQYSLLPETLTRIRACPDNARAQDDVFWMPWNTLAYDVHRVWNVWRHPEQRTDFALDCKRTPGSDYCSGCFFESHMGRDRLIELHSNLTVVQVTRKHLSTGFANGASCDLTDAFYVPGRLAPEFRDLCLLFARHHVQVELALTTILDTIAVRSEHEVLTHIDGSRKASELLEKYDRVGGTRTLDWLHPLKFSSSTLRKRQEEDIALAEGGALFTAPNISWLRRDQRREGGRPIVHITCCYPDHVVFKA